MAKSRPPKLEKKKRFRRRRVRQVGEPSAMDLIEEGVHLLRQTSLSAWAVYLCGVAPFIVGFLFFWTEMATSGLAGQVLAPASLGMAVLFVWMKLTQAYFCKGLRDSLLGEAGPAWTPRVWLRALRLQCFWQATGLIALPIACVFTLPFAWVFAFYQNLYGADPVQDTVADDFRARNWKLARIWHEQNWMLVSLLTLVFCLSWINFVSLLMLGPYLLKTLLGIETIFSRAGAHLLNSTSLFACVMLSYAVTDPLVKAAYLLRRHYSDARSTGADLELRLQGLERLSKLGSMAVVVLLGLLCVPQPAQAGVQVPPVVEQEDSDLLAPDALDASIDEVMARREFVWRFPREELEGAAEEPGWLKAWFETLERWEEKIERWIESWFDQDDKQEKKNRDWSWDGFAGLGSVFSYTLIGAFVLVVIYFAVRAWRMYQPLEALEGVAEDGGPTAVPDLNDEDVDADQLPRNEWIELARDLIAKGNYRLALRAYFLAQLAAFSGEGLVVIQRAKSNREYARELSTRAHGRSDLLALYRLEMRLFERSWYGDREAGPEEIKEMEGYLMEQGVLQ